MPTNPFDQSGAPAGPSSAPLAPTPPGTPVSAPPAPPALAGFQLPAAAAPPFPLDSEEEMPASLRAQLAALEAWAVANQRDARNDAIRFWVLKIPAIVASASAGIFAFYEWEVLPLIAGAIASACVLIDGFNPGGALRNAHYKAFYRLRELETAMVAKWRAEAYRATDPTEKHQLASTIIKDAEKKRGKISEELEKAETALGGK